jgi:hypothetical protein
VREYEDIAAQPGHYIVAPGHAEQRQARSA